jgi:transcriptional regulator
MSTHRPENLQDGSIDVGLRLLELVPRDEGLTIAEIAFVCGCSTTYISHLERSALSKLRRKFKGRGLDASQLLPTN